MEPQKHYHTVVYYATAAITVNVEAGGQGDFSLNINLFIDKIPLTHY